MAVTATILNGTSLRRLTVLGLCAVLLAGVVLLAAPSDGWGAHSYPRLVNIYFPSLGDSDLELLSRWDMLVLGKRAEEWQQAELAELRARNPEITLLAHMALGYNYGHTQPPINADLTATLNENGWLMRDTEGGFVVLGCEANLMNMTLECPTNDEGQRLCDWLPEYIAERLYAGGRWDGLFLDYCVRQVAWMDPYQDYPIDHDLDGLPAEASELDETWRLGMRACVSKLRDLVGDDFLLVANGNNTYYDLCDGDTRECFPRMHGDWYENMMDEEHGYLAFEALYRKPTTNIINSVWYGYVSPDGPIWGGEFEREFLFGLTSTLVFGSGYFSCDGPAHTDAWWFDYYDIDLGQPRGRAEDVSIPTGTVPPWVDLTELVKIRHFENGIAVINPCNWIIEVPLGGAYYDIHSWNGQFYEFNGLTTSLELSWRTGEVLMGTGVVPAQQIGAAWAMANRDAVELSWDPVDGASSYSVYRAKLDGDGNPVNRMLVSVVDEPLYTDEEVVGASNYRYYIASIDAQRCEGRLSRAIEVSTEPGSDLSIALMVDELDGRLALHWYPPVDSAPPSACYELIRTDGDGGRVVLNDEPLGPGTTVHTDTTAEPGRDYCYSLTRREGGVDETLASVRATTPGVPELGTSITSVGPQPASRETVVSFTLAEGDEPQGGSDTRLSVYDVTGRLVRRLVDGPLGAGRHVREWDLRNESGSRVASGCYLFVLEHGTERSTNKALVLR